MARSKRKNLTARPKQHFACELCHKSYGKAALLSRHQLSHTRPFKCICGQDFPSSSDLSRHKKTKHSENRDSYWVCTCDESKPWPRKDNFIAHLRRMHADDNNPDFIQQCERRRDVAEEVGQNQITHQGEKPSHANNHGSPADVQLNFENSTRFRGGLHGQPERLHDKSSHDRTKSTKRVKKSASKKGLKQRQSPRALKKESNQCTECTASFNRPSDLNKHIRKTHEKPWHFTHGCGQQFGAKYLWKNHERKEHLPGWIGPELYKALECQENLYTVMDSKAHFLKIYQKESPNSREFTDPTGGMSCSHFWCGFCVKYVQSQPMQDCLKVRYDHLGEHFLGHEKPSDFEMFKSEPQWLQAVCGDTVTTSEDPIDVGTPPRTAPAHHRTRDRTLQNNDKIERLSVLAEDAITRLESAQECAHRHAANHKREAAQAAAANLSGMVDHGQQQWHKRDEIQRLNKVWACQESLRQRTNAEDAKTYAGVTYERKTQGPFAGKLVSHGTFINIDGGDFIEHRVLIELLPH